MRLAFYFICFFMTVLLFPFVEVLASPDDGDNSNVFSEENFDFSKSSVFRIELPPGYYSEIDEHDEFSTSKIKKDGKIFVYIYKGDYDPFLKIKPRMGYESTKFLAGHVTVISEFHKGTLVRREILIKKNDTPKYIHIWTNMLSEEDMREADKIMFSFVLLN